ncbi:LysE family translocator [Arthrobacter sp. H5]|uniref:LysE family translocator n=1 Tax=Arthrobacter sp. H5 TaxID=1267973 RepID=UPI0006875D2E|nr:LysE family translocator [Arthrobacter sp. H5]
MSTSTYLALLGVAVVLAVTPGPDTMVTLSFALRERRAGLLAALGTTVGVFGWAALVAVGVAAFLKDSPVAFQALQLFGGAYLLFLGFRAVSAYRAAPSAPERGLIPPAGPAGSNQDLPNGAGTTTAVRPRTAAPQRTSRSAFMAGLLCCLTNPKTGLFFLALLPQFTPPDAGALFVVVVMGGTVAATLGIYLVGIALAAHTASTWLNRSHVTRWIDLISGGVFALLGLVITVPVVAAWF